MMTYHAHAQSTNDNSKIDIKKNRIINNNKTRSRAHTHTFSVSYAHYVPFASVLVCRFVRILICSVLYAQGSSKYSSKEKEKRLKRREKETILRILRLVIPFRLHRFHCERVCMMQCSYTLLCTRLISFFFIRLYPPFTHCVSPFTLYRSPDCSFFTYILYTKSSYFFVTHSQ